MERLRQELIRIDHKGYKAYKDIKGIYKFPGFELYIDHVQGDPFAAPSKIRVRVRLKDSGFPTYLFSNRSRQIAFQDFITRAFLKAIKDIAKGGRGTGKSGQISIDGPRQEILERTSCLIKQDSLEVRFFMGLPAHGRSVLARQAIEMFFKEIPEIVSRSLHYKNIDKSAIKNHVEIAEDQDHIRKSLRGKGFVAFIADGATLPRRSGIDDRPMQADIAIKFLSPASLKVEMETPNHGKVIGAGIKEGVTLIAGGGFHGKSTLLRAIERGVYNHILGDGRELVITREDAVKIRAEDGRYVEKADISSFINNLPGAKATTSFSTENASGSTSQAANIMEALEVGSRLLLIDEDTSATNFMIRDERMQALVSKAKEPITPFVDKVKELFGDLRCSTILVMGGSGDYFDVADATFVTDNYLLYDVTDKAKEIVDKFKSNRVHEGGKHFGTIPNRMPLASSFDPSRGKREVKIGAKGLKKILFGTTEIDLSFVEQIVDDSQTRAIGEIIYYYAITYAKKRIGLLQGLQEIMNIIGVKGLDYIFPYLPADYAAPRIFEVAAAINRMRSLEVGQATGDVG
ncbi:MAG: ABC-ATPase domain-containing protein [Thermodesulfobacteriota bacterium]|nr:ABC-ATPase domain-containing protein [Thermodesulfobacteriota bacterium]